MVLYKIKTLDLSSQILEITAQFESVQNCDLIVCLPAWRPGRYEMQDFAKKVTNFKAFDRLSNPLKVEKINKHTWKIYNTGGKIKVSYSYFADVLDAGNGCFFNQELVYINPCTCLVYTKDSLLEKAEIELVVDSSWKFSTSLERLLKHQNFHFQAKDYHELVDSPILLSPILQQLSFVSTISSNSQIGFNECKINLTVFSRLKVDMKRLKRDFNKFILEQAKIFDSFAQDEFEFQIIFTLENSFHAVEHYKSTVLCLGPDENIFSTSSQDIASQKSPSYDDLLIVASHEFFHFWNVKAFKPIELIVLDYSKESFSHLHYVTEGMTSYYEDLILLRAGLIDKQIHCKYLSKYWQYYADNSRLSHLSLAESSFESWLDGYSQTSPHRNNSFYVTGKLVALVLDFKIRKSTKNKRSLDDLMRKLYENFSGFKGYTKDDILKILQELSGINFAEFFDNFIYANTDLENVFRESLAYFGQKLELTVNPIFHIQKLGLKLNKNTLKISKIHPNSVAQKSKFMVGDEILMVNDIVVDLESFDKLLVEAGQKFELEIYRAGKTLKLKVQLTEQNYFDVYSVVYL